MSAPVDTECPIWAALVAELGDPEIPADAPDQWVQDPEHQQRADADQAVTR